MAKRAIDLSLEELAAMGAKAARTAAQESQRAGLTITGLVTVYDKAQAQSVLAQLQPSGTVTLVRAAADIESQGLSAGGRAKSGRKPDKKSDKKPDKAVD